MGKIKPVVATCKSDKKSLEAHNRALKAKNKALKLIILELNKSVKGLREQYQDQSNLLASILIKNEEGAMAFDCDASP
jgi:peptidoglycan hydrolase CwlO-like protein